MNSWRNEDGVALITALMAVVILGGMAVVFVNRATTEQRASGASQQHETVLHTAEAAADVQIAALNASDTHVTRDNGDAEVTVAGVPADERQWLEDLEPRMRDSEAWVAGDAGESYAVRPFDTTTGEPMDVIYARGAIPSFDAPNARIRSIKLQVAQDNYVPRFALLTDGALDFGGNASIVHPDCNPSQPDTCIADVHVNGSATNPGSASVIQGQLRVAGGPCPSIDATNGCVADGVQPQPVPQFSARTFYARHDEPFNPDPSGETVRWYDLCPDGTIKAPATSGPCTGDQLWPNPSDPDAGTHTRGWEWRSGQNEWRASALQSGVFYVYGADAQITGSAPPGRRAVSILVEASSSQPTRSGSLSIRGNPRLQAAMQDILFILDRDLDVNGNASGGTGEACGDAGATFSGFIGVTEQLKVGGTATLRGAAIVRDAEQVHGLVTRNNDGISGTMCLEYDDNLSVDLTGIWVVTFWNEM